jgi:HK97 family phage major capsid protein
MLTSNREIIQKADLAVADLVSSGGYLQPAQAQKFIQLLIDESTIMKYATVTPMKAPKQLIEGIGFGSRVLRAGTEAVALPVNDRTKPDLTKKELNAQLFRAECRLSYESLEDNIEKGDLKNTIMALLGKAIARDMDEVIINGDINSADLFLKQLNGILKQATTNPFNGLDAVLSATILKGIVKAMPARYLADKKRLAFFTSVDAESDYADSLAGRATALGDQNFQDDVVAKYRGIPVVPCSLFPENIGTSSHCTDVIFTDPKNINVGIWRQIMLETDKDISAGQLIIVATLRFDVKFVEEPGVVKGYNVKVV